MEMMYSEKPCKQARRIVVNDKEYWWAYIKSKLLIWDNNVKTVISDTEFTGLTSDEIERGKCKKWFSITPSAIAEWIKEKYNENNMGSR